MNVRFILLHCIWDSETTDGFTCGGADLEPGPECEVDAIQVIIQAGYAPFVHNQLMVVVDANHEQEAQDVPCLLHCAISTCRSNCKVLLTVCSAVAWYKDGQQSIFTAWLPSRGFLNCSVNVSSETCPVQGQARHKTEWQTARDTTAQHDLYGRAQRARAL